MVRGTVAPTAVTVGVAKVKPLSDGSVMDARSAELRMPSVMFWASCEMTASAPASAA